MTTKTSTTKTTPKPKVVKAGGTKGQRIVEILRQHPEKSRRSVAEEAGATVGRVGEVIRWLRDNGTKEEKAIIARHTEEQAAVKTVAKAAPAKKAPAKRTTKATPAKRTTAKRAPVKRTAKATPAKDLPATEEEFVDEVRSILKG